MAIKSTSKVQQQEVTIKPYPRDTVQITIYTNETPVYKKDEEGNPTEEVASYEYDFNMFYTSAGYLDLDDVRANPANYLNYITYDKAIQDRLAEAAQQFMDNAVQQRNYDNIQSVCTYVTSTNPKFKAEAEACVAWRDAVWTRCYAIMDDCMAGKRTIPTPDELIAELPELSW